MNGDGNTRRGPRLVSGGLATTMASGDRLFVFAEGPLYPHELPRLRFWPRTQQLGSVRVPRQTSLLDLYSGPAGTRGSHGPSERPVITRSDPRSGNPLRRRTQETAVIALAPREITGSGAGARADGIV